jgi:myo-inositol-1(or 4)-monophosphatase
MNLSNDDLKRIIMTVSSVVLELGILLSKAFNEAVESFDKTSPQDIVTKHDKEGEIFLYKKLHEFYPDFGFLGEEGGYKNHREDKPYWVVDPIDGTLNFARGIPTFAISVALCYLNTSYAAVCYNPITKELFTAALGLGAFLNGAAIKTSKVHSFERAILSIPPNLMRLSDPGAVIRRQGSAVLDICYIAKGSIDAYYDASLYPWDFAAASLVASESGALIFSLKTKTLDTNKKSDILIANKNIADKFVKWISTGKL